MINSLIIDFLIRIKNGYMATRKTIEVVNSKYCVAVAALMKRYGYIGECSINEDKKTMTISLLYDNDQPRVTNVKIFSKPGRHIYEKASSIPWGQSKNSLIIISTSSGVMSQKEAVKNKIGGELIAEIY